MSLYDTSEIGSVKIVMLKGQDGQGADNIYALEGAGKMTSYLGNVVSTDITLHRTPKTGDRFLIYVDEQADTPESILVYGTGSSDPYTIPFIGVVPEYMKGLCLVELTEPFEGITGAEIVFMDEGVEYTAGTGISVQNGVITNTKPQTGDNIKAYTVTSITAGELGSFDIATDYLMLTIDTDSISTDSDGGYFCFLSSDMVIKKGVLMSPYDITTRFKEPLVKGMTLTVKTRGSGSGSAQDPIQMAIVQISNGYTTAGRFASSTAGVRSTAEGWQNTASGLHAHAGGFGCVAAGGQSFAHGANVTAGQHFQAAFGIYNDNKTDSLFEVGNGTVNAKSNAMMVKSNGNVIAGKDVLDADGHSLHAAGSAVETEKTATGNPVIVEDALESNADGLVAKIVPIQSGSGDPSPENVRPISGRTSVNIKDEGRNLFNKNDLEVGAIDPQTGENVSHATTMRTAGYISVQPNTTYTFSAETLGAFRLFEYTDTAYIGSTVGAATMTTGSTTTRVRLHAPTFETMANTFMMEVGNVATAYEPYITPVTLTIALGTTVYGGSLDVKTGVGTITHALGTLTGAESESWEMTSGDGWHQFYTAISASLSSADSISNRFEPIQLSDRGTKTGLVQHTDKLFRFALVDSQIEITSVDDWKTWLASNNVQVCYKLATPTNIQLTGEELALLMGYNRVSSDSGDITLTYKANAVQDLQTDKADNADMVDYIENGNKASRAYTANQFMLWKGDLYKVTTSIASGATITAGTNVTKTTIGAVLTALLNA